MTDEKDSLNDLLFGEDLIEGELTDKQWKILEAAIEVFSEKGFEASRTSDIAKSAEVAEGTIFRYYKTKKDLLVGLLFPLIIKFFRPLVLRSVENILKDKQKPIEELMKEVYLDRLILARKNLPLIKTVIIESVYHPELLEPLREKFMPQVAKLIESIVKENIEKGVLREIDPNIVTRSAMSLLAGYISLTSLFPNTFPIESDEREVEKLVDLILNGIIKK